MTNRIVCNVGTGSVSEIPYTPEEQAAHDERVLELEAEREAQEAAAIIAAQIAQLAVVNVRSYGYRIRSKARALAKQGRTAESLKFLSTLK